MQIIYVGDLFDGSTSKQRMQAIKNLGYKVIPIDITPEEIRYKQKLLFYRIIRKIIGPLDLSGINLQLLNLFREEDSYNVLWIDKGLTVKAETLQKVKQLSPKTIIVGYSPDDMMNSENQSRQFLKGLSYYDIFYTTKSYGVDELRKLGCKHVKFVHNGYDPNTHRPVSITEEYKKKIGGAIGFIGCYERDRKQSMLFLAENGIPVKIYGYGWQKNKISHPNLVIENKFLFGNDYAKALCAFDINLCFLRKVNRDLQTSRSMEIPACRGFMLAERTREHLELFEEDKEAVYFSSDEELLEKVRYYMTHGNEREKIAQAGFERCLTSGYSNIERMKKIFYAINNIYKEKFS